MKEKIKHKLSDILIRELVRLCIYLVITTLFFVLYNFVKNQKRDSVLRSQFVINITDVIKETDNLCKYIEHAVTKDSSYFNSRLLKNRIRSFKNAHKQFNNDSQKLEEWEEREISGCLLGIEKYFDISFSLANQLLESDYGIKAKLKIAKKLEINLLMLRIEASTCYKEDY